MMQPDGDSPDGSLGALVREADRDFQDAVVIYRLDVLLVCASWQCEAAGESAIPELSVVPAVLFLGAAALDGQDALDAVTSRSLSALTPGSSARTT